MKSASAATPPYFVPRHDDPHSCRRPALPLLRLQAPSRCPCNTWLSLVASRSNRFNAAFLFCTNIFPVGVPDLVWVGHERIRDGVCGVILNLAKRA